MSIKTHVLGFPRIGPKRELKFALEAYWKKEIEMEQLQKVAKEVRSYNYQAQLNQLSYVTVGDFGFYDRVLDMSFLLGHLPTRAISQGVENTLDGYFQIARGYSVVGDQLQIKASEMTKWFNTNYHYIVPELDASTTFQLTIDSLKVQIEEVLALKGNPKPAIIGPVTYLYLSKSMDGTDRLLYLDSLLEVYSQLLTSLKELGVEWVQIDEPIFSLELEGSWKEAITKAYEILKNSPVKLLLATYFEQLQDNLNTFASLPVSGFHIDATYGHDEINKLINLLNSDQILSIGVVNGRNIWKSKLNELYDQLATWKTELGEDRLWVSSSCSLLHVPVDLGLETVIDSSIKEWLSFGIQKIEEIQLLAKGLNEGQQSIANELSLNQAIHQRRAEHPLLNNASVKASIEGLNPAIENRKSKYEDRAEKQRANFNFSHLPTTTIGSFPQTQSVRTLRRRNRTGELTDAEYTQAIQAYIQDCIERQEEIGLDVLVHGEPERNDMVEYFGEQLDGFVFTKYGWVQSYGSRCVKPPIIFGDVYRSAPMTVEWIQFAQSCSKKFVKGMLTGPVTILNWSFVRDDQSREDTCLQIALAIREEVLDLEKSGTKIIQIDEAALREGLPLRKSDWAAYLNWAIRSFRITASGVEDETQIHTHMCYSDFNSIIQSIADMDADVITIETSRSDASLLDAFDRFDYPNEIGPGVYDIHSPNIPTVEEIIQLLKSAMKRIPVEKLWVNPDCGLKTRSWGEVELALKNMVTATKQLKKELDIA